MCLVLLFQLFFAITDFKKDLEFEKSQMRAT